MAGTSRYILKSTTDLSTVSGPPVVGDWLICGEGNQTITTNLTQFNALTGGAGADGFEKILIKRGFTGTLGGGGASFEADVSYNTTSVFTYDAGGGSLYYKAANTANTCDRFKQTGFGKFYFTGGTITNFEQFRGYSNINSSGIVTNADIMGGVVDADYKSNFFDTVIVKNATLNSQRGFTTSVTLLVGSTLNVFRVDTNATMPTAGTINVHGGKLNWRGGDITTLNAYSPIDMSNVATPITVSTLKITADALAASNLNEARTSGQVGVTYSSIKVVGGYEDKLGTSLP